MRDAFALWKAATPRKALNYFVCNLSYLFSRITHRAVLAGSPSFVHIEPTNRCNLQCPECPTGKGFITRPRGDISMDNYSGILNSLSKSAFYFNLYFQGEPYLHQQLPEMIRLAKEKNLYVVTSTNAQKLDVSAARQTITSGLNRIIISFDGPDAEAYESYRKGGDWKKVILAVQHLTNEKAVQHSSKPLVILQCLLLKANENKKGEVIKLAHSLGADALEFKTLQLLDCTKASEILPTKESDTRYFQHSSPHYIPRKPRKHVCSHLFNSCVITWDGNVVPCCYDKNAEHSFGNLNNSTFQEIWKGSARRAFINKVIRNKPSIDICANCQ